MSFTGKKYSQDIILRIEGDNSDDVFWEAARITNEVKPEYKGNIIAFVTRDSDALAIMKRTEEAK